jgi:hypothetical protein
LGQDLEDLEMEADDDHMTLNMVQNNKRRQKYKVPPPSNFKNENHQQSPFVTAPIRLNGLAVRAGVDSMATHSFVSPALAEALRTKIIPTSGTLQLGAKGARVPRVGKTQPIEVRCGNTTVSHVFEVLELGSPEINCIIVYETQY